MQTGWCQWHQVDAMARFRLIQQKWINQMYVKNADRHLSKVTMVDGRRVLGDCILGQASLILVNSSPFIEQVMQWAITLWLMLVVAHLMLIVHHVTLLCTLPLVSYPQPAEPVDLLSQNDIHWPMLGYEKRDAVIDLYTITLTNKAAYDQELASYSRDVNETFMSETETRRPKNCPRRDRYNLKQYLSSHNLDAIDHHHGCFLNSYNTLVPCIWYNLKNIIVDLCAVCIIHESIIVNSIQSSCWSLDMKISSRSDTWHILYLVWLFKYVFELELLI